MICNQCKKEIQEGTVVCPYCGYENERTMGVFDKMPDFQGSSSSPMASDPGIDGSHNGSVGFGEAVTLFFKNYVNFSGRASKSEYWWAFLFNIIISIALSIISSVLPPLGGLCTIALIIPGISLAVRRLHDVGKSGVWCFMGVIPIVGVIFLLIQFLKDSEGANQWGPGPADVGFAEVQNNASVNDVQERKVVTDKDIYVMAEKHEPMDLFAPGAKQHMDAALSKVISTYTGIENLAGAIMLSTPQSIQDGIAAADTDTLLVILKALGYYSGQGVDEKILDGVQQNVLSTLKKRLSE